MDWNAPVNLHMIWSETHAENVLLIASMLAKLSPANQDAVLMSSGRPIIASALPVTIWLVDHASNVQETRSMSQPNKTVELNVLEDKFGLTDNANA